MKFTNKIKQIIKLIAKHKLIPCSFAFLALILSVALTWQLKGMKIKAVNQESNITGNVISEEERLPTENVNPLNGLSCDNYKRRPMAVVLANDPVARPLSGINEADLVFEMPVITSDITRIIAVYTCNEPEEIGATRSARGDFIPLAMGIDAILAHWGGSHFALDELNDDVMDNIDALPNPFNAFYRKSGVSAPHNGFTSFKRLLSSAAKLGYRLENKFTGYTFESSKPKVENSGKELIIRYNYPYNVEYHYSAESNSYFRWRAGLREMDKEDDKQVEAKNVVVMRAFSRQIEDQYNDLDIEGEGECQVYKNGDVFDCRWEKDKNDPKSKLYFLSKNNGAEVPFVPGQVWIEIVEPDQEVRWE